ncbi:MAG TPA: hypothetical protein VFP78_09320 [Solirubrobacteraceae bacterium]|nr:hypothetical protein [Solirubrobacteraceae bacterium]
MAADAVEHCEEHDMGRRSHVAGSSRAFSRLTPILVARKFRAAGAGAKRAAG